MKNYDEFEQWLLRGAPDEEFGDETEYPIAGCREVLSEITESVLESSAQTILCIGPGSEYAARRLYDEDCDVWLFDPSMERLSGFAIEMPSAHMFHYDVFDGMPAELFDTAFDAVICTYTMHTVGDDEKMWLIDDLVSLLEDDGTLYIGDVCFWSSAEREICSRRCSETWDEEASYIVFDDFCRYFDERCVRFTRISHCAGIIELGRALDNLAY